MKICGTVAFAVAFLATCSLAALRRADDVQTPAPGERDVCGYPCSTSMDCADASGDCPFCLEGQCVDRRCGQFCNSNFNCDFIGCSECIDSRCMPATAPPIPPPPPPLPVGWGALWCLSYNNCSSWGAYAQATSEQQANQLAQEFCGDGSNCALQKTFSAGPLSAYTCLGLATMANGNFAWTVGTTAEGVANSSLVSCSGTGGQNQCQVVFAQCASPPAPGTLFGALSCGPLGCGLNWAYSGSEGESGWTNQSVAADKAIAICSRKSGHECKLQQLFMACSAIYAAPNSETQWAVGEGSSPTEAGDAAAAACSKLGSGVCQFVASNCLTG